MDLGSLGEWVSGIGALAAALVALRVAGDGRRAAADARAAMVRDRVAAQLVALMQASAEDFAQLEQNHGSVLPRSPAAVAACQALWRHRGPIGEVWGYYCEPSNDPHSRQAAAGGHLVPTMRTQLREALDNIDRQDELPPPADGLRARLLETRRRVGRRLSR